MMGEINAKAAVGEYLHAIRQIRDDPNGASARLESFARWSVEMKQALAGVVCCSSPTVKHFKFEQRGKRRLHKRPNAYEIDRCHHW
jgi:hypothetical protein